MRNLVALALLIGLVAAPATAQRSVIGNWLTEDREAIIALGRCGNAICGRIARILVPTPEADQRDTNNPNPALRNRRIEGLQILSGFRLDDGQYRHGQVYDPKSGRSYNARLRLNANGSLRVTGCVLGGIICRSETWTRR